MHFLRSLARLGGGRCCFPSEGQGVAAVARQVRRGLQFMSYHAGQQGVVPALSGVELQWLSYSQPAAC